MSTRAVFAHNIVRAFLGDCENLFSTPLSLLCVRKLLRHHNIWGTTALLPGCQNHNEDPEANRVSHFVDFICRAINSVLLGRAKTARGKVMECRRCVARWKHAHADFMNRNGVKPVGFGGRLGEGAVA
jgi:hypothetical protein